MKEYASTIARYTLYPLFYFLALSVSFYITFPWSRVRDRLIAEFDKSQATKGDKAWRLEIGDVSGYWLTGVEMSDVKIIIPPNSDDAGSKSSPFSPSAPFPGTKPMGARKAAAAAADDDGGDDAKDASATKDTKPAAHESIMLVSKAHARLRVLPLLIGRLRIDFGAEAFGGEVKGTIPIGGGTLDVEVDKVDLSQVAPLGDVVSVPIKGVANGKLEISNDGQKWSKAVGSLDLTVADVAIGDGKAKLAGMATLPTAQLGTLEISGKATDGILKFDKFGATGKDVQLVGDGYLRLKEPWDSSSLDFVIRILFTDAYKSKDDKTKALFGDPGDPTPALIDLNPKMKSAKRDDGFFGFRGHGALKSLKWEPTKEDGPAKAPTAKGGDDSSTTKTKTPTPSKSTPSKKKPTTPTPGDEPRTPPTHEPTQPKKADPDSDPNPLPIEKAAPPPPQNDQPVQPIQPIMPPPPQFPDIPPQDQPPPDSPPDAPPPQ